MRLATILLAGDEVFGLTYGGGYAEYVPVSKKMFLRKPRELSWEECAAVPEVPLPFYSFNVHVLTLPTSCG